MLIEREGFINKIELLLGVSPIVAILGPRQCGKTTIARQFSRKEQTVHFLDLEDPIDLSRLANPKLALESLEGLVVIDEIQRAPDLFPVLRVLVDRVDNKSRFLILGSASRELIRQSSESLAGRIGYLELAPLSIEEVGQDDLNRLWLRGGLPRSFLADTDQSSKLWRQSYISTFLERDIPNLGIKIPSETLRRFWMMLVHYHGQILNYSELGRSFGIADTTVKHYLDILSGTFMLRQLFPWHENISKRQVKSPKLYFRDSGIFHYFIGTNSKNDLLSHPKLGASWEAFALEEIIRTTGAAANESFFWATHSEAEVDLLVVKDGRREGYEIKYTDSPKVTRSMKIAMTDLGLNSLNVIFPGDISFPLADNVTASGLKKLLGDNQKMALMNHGGK